MSTTQMVLDLDQVAINTIRTLAIDAIQQANSGHPGTPMGMAPVVYCLWQCFLRFDPEDPIWPNRDRFVLSAGHASMLLYSLLYLTGVKAVNPQYERLRTPSVTRPPAGGGMATGSHWLGQHLNRPDFPMFDYDVYSLGGDGCIMEGISN